MDKIFQELFNELQKLQNKIIKDVNDFAYKSYLPLCIVKLKSGYFYWAKVEYVSTNFEKLEIVPVKRRHDYVTSNLTWEQLRKFNDEIFKKYGSIINWFKKEDIELYRKHVRRYVEGRWVKPSFAKKLVKWNNVLQRIKKLKKKLRKLSHQLKEINMTLQQIQEAKRNIRKQVNKRRNIKIKKDMWYIKKQGKFRQLQKLEIQQIKKSKINVVLDEKLKNAIRTWKILKEKEKKNKQIFKEIYKIRMQKRKLEEEAIAIKKIKIPPKYYTSYYTLFRTFTLK